MAKGLVPHFGDQMGTRYLMVKCPYDQKINSYFSLDFRTMLTKTLSDQSFKL